MANYKINFFFIITLITLLTSCNTKTIGVTGESLVDEDKAKEILHNAVIRSEQINSYKSEIIINELYISKQSKTPNNLKCVQEYNKDLGLHQVLEFKKGNVTEKYILKDRSYLGDLNKTTNKIEWDLRDISYEDSLSESLFNWDVNDLLSISDIKYKYFNIENHKHKVEFSGNIQNSNESVVADILWNSLGIYLVPFVGTGDIIIDGIVEVDEKTSNISKIAFTIIYNRNNESDIEYNNIKINVEFNNYQFDEIKNIQLPIELQ